MSEKSLSRWLLFVVAASGVAYVVFAASFFPNRHGRLGGDYEYFLPLLLAGKYWIAANGILAAPRFSPAFCGGLPLLANPQSIFYSIPQLLSFVVGPITSFLATTVIFAWIGAGGTFLLLARRFGTSSGAAALSAAIFLFNGFLLHRMAIGHVTYHVVGLVPLLCYWLLVPFGRTERPIERLRQAVRPTAGAAVLIAYFVYAGAPNIVVPLAMTCIMVWLMHALIRKPTYAFWPIGCGAALIAGILATAKLAPALIFIRQFPRPDPLQIFHSATALFYGLLEGFFLPSSLPDHFAFLARHELEFGLGPVPLLLIIMGLLAGTIRSGLWSLVKRTRPESWLKLTALGLLTAVPIWLNLGGPAKEVWLRSLPYIGDNVVLVRWFYIYLLPLTIATGLLLDFVFPTMRERMAAAIVGMLLTIVPAIAANRSYYESQAYDPSAIVAANAALATTGRVPAVTRIGSSPTARQANDGLASGQSAFPCYEPIFGYRLEIFPNKPAPGLLFSASDTTHLRNPACYIYGRENNCAPGDAFTPAQQAEETLFARYHGFAFTLPEWQRWADRLSVSGLAGVLIGLAISRRRKNRRAAGPALKPKIL